MAEYVARNGDEFQDIVLAKKRDDSRFAFLHSGNAYHNYYLTKKKEFAARYGRNLSETSTKATLLAAANTPNNNTSESKSNYERQLGDECEY